MNRLAILIFALTLTACATSQFQTAATQFHAADNVAAMKIATNPYNPDPLLPACLVWQQENFPQIQEIINAPVSGPLSLVAKQRSIARLFGPDSPQRIGAAKACGPVWADILRKRFGVFIR